MLAKTPLYANHQAQNAKMVDFHGWDMPLHYGSQLKEHQYVREDAGMFDVSHMTIVDVLGAGGRLFLRRLLTNDIDLLPHTGRALYSCMCNEHGGIIDDLICYQRHSDNYRLILNSATRGRVLDWLRTQIQGFAAGLQERLDLAMLAVQGPKAIEKVSSILNPAQIDAITTLAPFESVEIEPYFIARTGYTGEDGFEIIVPQEMISDLWNKLLSVGVQPCGLAARDTLRLEAGMFLNGQDMDETTTPLESGLEWTIKWEPLDRDFIGMGALLALRQHIQNKMVGLTLSNPGIMRPGQSVIIEGHPPGIITSGTYSPTLRKSIAFARVPIGIGTDVQVDIRGTLHPAKVVPPRFIKRGKPL